MAVSAGTAFVDVKPDLTGFSKDLDRSLDKVTADSKSKFSKFGKVVAAGALAGAAGFAAIGKSAIDAASDISEAESKNQKLFGASAKSVEAFAKTSAKSYGISKKAALEYTGTFGNLFRALGESEKGAADQSVALSKLAADMASFNNTSVEDALEAIRSGLVGESEPLRKFGVNMNDVTLKAQAMSMGLIKNTKGALDPHTKAMAASALIAKQTEKAHGDFADTSGGLANQQKIVKARLDDATAALGAKLLPAALAVVTSFDKLIAAFKTAGEWLAKHKTEAVAVGVAVGGLALALGTYAAATKIAALGTAALNAVMAMNPIGAVVIALAALAGAIYYAYQKSAQFRAIVDKVWDGLKDVGEWIVSVGAAFWEKFGGVIMDQIRDVWTFIQTTFAAIQRIFQGLVDFVAGVFTGDWSRAWDGVKNIFGGIWDLIVGRLRLAWETLKNVVRAGLIAIVEIVHLAAEGLVALGGWIIDRIVAGVKAAAAVVASAAGWLKDQVVTGIRAYAETYLAIGSWVIDKIWDGIKAFGGLAASIGEWLLGKVTSGVHGLKEHLEGLGGKLIGFIGDGIQAGVKGILGFFDKIINKVESVIDLIGKIKPPKIDLPDLNPFGGEGGGNVGPGNIGLVNSVQAIADDSVKWGLSGGRGPGQAYRPGDDGYHGLNRARDLSGSPAAMYAYAKMLLKSMGSRLLELIYSPLGIGIKNGKVVDILSFYGRSVYNDHFDHVHVAMAKGGILARGGVVKRPTILMGEEAPRFPEFVIPTNPAHRDRAMGLFAGAAGALGVGAPARIGPAQSSGAFATGGIIRRDTITNVEPTDLAGQVVHEHHLYIDGKEIDVRIESRERAGQLAYLAGATR